MSDDIISRQAAIDIADKFSDADGCNGSDVATDIISGLISLPSSQPERKTSEWLHEYLQTAVDFGIITETQASRLMDMIAEDNT